MAEAKEELDLKFANYDKTGPLGSIDRRQVLDFEELRDLLNRRNSVLADRRNKKNIYHWARSLDGVTPVYTIPDECRDLSPIVIPP